MAMSKHECAAFGPTLLAAALAACLPIFTAMAFASSPISVLAEPTPVKPGQADPAIMDPDADGVPSDTDNCPFRPNPKGLDGTQAQVCGTNFVAQGDPHVYLKSRVFRPIRGLDPALAQLDSGKRIHVLLHLSPGSQGALLPRSRHTLLTNLGVRFLGYLPDDAYYVSLPPDTATLNAIISVDGVRGISARLPADRVAPALRLRGPIERAADQSFELDVEFFEDVTQPEIESMLSALKLNFKHQYDTTYSLRFDAWPSLAALASHDSVKWIDEPDGDPANYTQNAQATIVGGPVSENLGYRGAGLTVAMFEPGPLRLDPPHPDMQGRLTIGNTPYFAYPENQHAWNVASILIADETSHPDNMGFLPDARLVAYSADRVQTRKRRFFGIPKEAREDHGALLINNSWGNYKCSKIGEYTGHAKFRDRVVFDHQMIVVDGAGNGRADNEYPEDGCKPDQYSLGLYNAKNSIMVGNWSLETNALSSSSSKGPAADGRLKPDIVAPGDGVATLNFFITGIDDVSGVSSGGIADVDFLGESFPATFYGTSAAAPVVSGVVGWIGEAFIEQGYDVESILPAAVKAILIHTARDVGLVGPDFDHGYGLVQAAPAVRMAQEWSSWGRDHTFTEEGETHEFTFDVNSTMFTYKATLVWDDVEGEDTANKSLKNDLNLTLISPSGVPYFPFDLRFPFGTGSTPARACTVDSCDDTNNVEQVVVHSANGAPIETGPWRAVVNARRLVSNEQRMALVLTPPCPVVIDQDVTLTAPLSCTPHPLQPAAVEIVTDNVTLNCDDQSISGTVSDAANTRDYVGVSVQANGVRVERCVLDRFDVGVRVGNNGVAVTNARILNNGLTNMTRRGIDLWGDEHTLSLNQIDDMGAGAHGGIVVHGDRNLISANRLNNYTEGDPPVGIYIGSGGETNAISANILDGDWNPAIHLKSDDEAQPVTGSAVLLNVIRKIPGTGIALTGRVTNSNVDGNRIEWFGRTDSAILIEALAGLAPNQSNIALNLVRGSQQATQTGIRVNSADFSNINRNILLDLGIGVHDSLSEASWIWIENNAMFSADTDQPYRSVVGVLRQGGAVSIVRGNRIEDSIGGISVLNTTEQLLLHSNIINVSSLGISVVNGPGADIAGNSVVAELSGISLFGGADVNISGNSVSGFLNTGIYAWQADNLTLSNNIINESASAVVGGNGAIGVHYATGITASLSNNNITLTTWGTGIQLGLNPTPPCTGVVVEDVTVELNTIQGAGSDFVAGCDVGSYTYVP